MSRHIRMQIPQMQKQEKRKNTGMKKKVDKSACLLVISLLFFGIQLFFSADSQ